MQVPQTLEITILETLGCRVAEFFYIKKIIILLYSRYKIQIVDVVQLVVRIYIKLSLARTPQPSATPIAQVP